MMVIRNYDREPITNISDERDGGTEEDASVSAKSKSSEKH